MKKKLIKEILEIDKLLKHEKKHKEKISNELQKLGCEINIIEEKIKNEKIKKNILNVSNLNKLYSIAIKKYNEKIYIENNLSEFKKENNEKEIDLEKKYKILIDKSKTNDEIITKRKEELEKIYDKIIKNKIIEEEKEQIIISPDIMSIYLESKISKEIEFMDKIKLLSKKIRIKNDKILKQIDSHFKTLTIMKSKKESSSNAEQSTGVKNSSHFSKQNLLLQQLEVINKLNTNNNNNNIDENDLTSSISMEIETNINLDNLPSDDESLRFIDKVFDTKSNIKPIKNRLKSVIDSSVSGNKEKLIKVEPIKIEKPIDYKNKEINIIKKIEIIREEIENKKKKINEIKNKKINIQEKYNINEKKLNQALMKIKIINDKMDLIKKQIEDFTQKQGKYYRILSINNIINNKNYCIFDKNENNIIYDMETFRK